MNKNRPLRPARQRSLEFAAEDEVAPRLPETALREAQSLIAQLLLLVVRRESETQMRGDEHERQDHA